MSCVWCIEFISFTGLSDQKTKETQKQNESNTPKTLNDLASLVYVSNLGHTGDVKPIIFHPTALEFIRGEDPTIRREIGEALRDLQKGLSLGMPLSRPMPQVAQVLMNSG